MKPRKHTRRGMRFFCAVLIALTLGLSACGDGGGSSGTASGSAQ